jgi:hypothetical protein
VSALIFERGGALANDLRGIAGKMPRGKATLENQASNMRRLRVGCCAMAVREQSSESPLRVGNVDAGVFCDRPLRPAAWNASVPSRRPRLIVCGNWRKQIDTSAETTGFVGWSIMSAMN